jgi:hypothetical protein
MQAAGRVGARPAWSGPSVCLAELARREFQLEELSPLNELASDVVVRLDVGEVLARTQERGGDDP